MNAQTERLHVAGPAGAIEVAVDQPPGVDAPRGVAVLVILHDLNLAARYADRLVMLEQGRLMADGSPAEVLTPELIARLYDYPAQVIHHPETGQPMVV